MAKISKLKAVNPKEAAPSKPKILVFGKPGVGKTWTSLDFPSVYYIDTEGGADLPHYTDKLTKSGGVYFGKEQGSLSFESIIEQVQALATEEHHFRTLVIDSISNVFNLEVAKEMERLGDKDAFGASKKPAVAFMRRLISWLMRLDMNVIMIAHEKSEWRNGEQIGDTFDCWDKLEYELHLCLRITKEGPKRLARVRKTRLKGFPDGESFPWSYSEFAERYGKDILEKEAVAIELATEEQLQQLDELLAVVKVEDKEREKWFSAAGVESFGEMDTEKVAKLITHLESKLPTKKETKDALSA